MRIQVVSCLPFGHCFTPKHLHSACSLLCAVCRTSWNLLGQHNTSVLWSSFYSILFSGSVFVTFGHCLTTLLDIWPLPQHKTVCTSCHVLCPVFRTNLLACWPLPHSKISCTSLSCTISLFQNQFAGQLVTALLQNIVHFISHTLPCFQDQFACHLATASPQNVVHFISHTVPCFQDQFACPLTTASHIHTYKSENQHSRGISVVSVVGPQ